MNARGHALYLLASRDTIIIPRVFVQIAGDIKSAILLSYIVDRHIDAGLSDLDSWVDMTEIYNVLIKTQLSQEEYSQSLIKLFDWNLVEISHEVQGQSQSVRIVWDNFVAIIEKSIAPKKQIVKYKDDAVAIFKKSSESVLGISPQITATQAAALRDYQNKVESNLVATFQECVDWFMRSNNFYAKRNNHSVADFLVHPIETFRPRRPVSIEDIAGKIMETE